MNIMQTTTITGVPGYEKIVIEPSEHSSQGVHIVLDDGSEPLMGGSGPCSFGISEVRELRDALVAALDHAEDLMAALGTAPAPEFEVGQELEGGETLPVGSTVRDRDGDIWVCGPEGYGSGRTGTCSLWTVVGIYHPVRIESLPS